MVQTKYHIRNYPHGILVLESYQNFQEIKSIYQKASLLGEQSIDIDGKLIECQNEETPYFFQELKKLGSLSIIEYLPDHIIFYDNHKVIDISSSDVRKCRKISRIFESCAIQQFKIGKKLVSLLDNHHTTKSLIDKISEDSISLSQTSLDELKTESLNELEYYENSSFLNTSLSSTFTNLNNSLTTKSSLSKMTQEEFMSIIRLLGKGKDHTMLTVSSYNGRKQTSLDNIYKTLVLNKSDPREFMKDIKYGRESIQLLKRIRPQFNKTKMHDIISSVTNGLLVLLLKKQGVVFSVGLSKIPGIQTHWNPYRIKKLPLNIIQVALGSEHVIFLTEEGKVYGLGDNTCCQLTSYLPRKVMIATEIPNLPIIKSVACGAYHSLVMRDDFLLGWGLNICNQLGQLNNRINQDAFSLKSFSNLIENWPFLCYSHSKPDYLLRHPTVLFCSNEIFLSKLNEISSLLSQLQYRCPEDIFSTFEDFFKTEKLHLSYNKSYNINNSVVSISITDEGVDQKVIQNINEYTKDPVFSSTSYMTQNLDKEYIIKNEHKESKEIKNLVHSSLPHNTAIFNLEEISDNSIVHLEKIKLQKDLSISHNTCSLAKNNDEISNILFTINEESISFSNDQKFILWKIFQCYLRLFNTNIIEFDLTLEKNILYRCSLNSQLKHNTDVMVYNKKSDISKHEKIAKYKANFVKTKEYSSLVQHKLELQRMRQISLKKNETCANQAIDEKYNHIDIPNCFSNKLTNSGYIDSKISTQKNESDQLFCKNKKAQKATNFTGDIINGKKNIKTCLAKIACSDNSSICLTDTGDLYIAGNIINNNKDKIYDQFCKYSSRENISNFVVIKNYSTYNYDFITSLGRVPKKTPKLGIFAYHYAKKIFPSRLSSGSWFTIFLEKNDSLFINLKEWFSNPIHIAFPLLNNSNSEFTNQNKTLKKLNILRYKKKSLKNRTTKDQTNIFLSIDNDKKSLECIETQVSQDKDIELLSKDFKKSINSEQFIEVLIHFLSEYDIGSFYINGYLIVSESGKRIIGRLPLKFPENLEFSFMNKEKLGFICNISFDQGTTWLHTSCIDLQKYNISHKFNISGSFSQVKKTKSMLDSTNQSNKNIEKELKVYNTVPILYCTIMPSYNFSRQQNSTKYCLACEEQIELELVITENNLTVTNTLMFYFQSEEHTYRVYQLFLKAIKDYIHLADNELFENIIKSENTNLECNEASIITETKSKKNDSICSLWQSLTEAENNLNQNNIKEQQLNSIHSTYGIEDSKEANFTNSVQDVTKNQVLITSLLKHKLFSKISEEKDKLMKKNKDLINILHGLIHPVFWIALNCAVELSTLYCLKNGNLEEKIPISKDMTNSSNYSIALASNNFFSSISNAQKYEIIDLKSIILTITDDKVNYFLSIKSIYENKLHWISELSVNIIDNTLSEKKNNINFDFRSVPTSENLSNDINNSKSCNISKKKTLINLDQFYQNDRMKLVLDNSTEFEKTWKIQGSDNFTAFHVQIYLRTLLLYDQWIYKNDNCWALSRNE